MGGQNVVLRARLVTHKMSTTRSASRQHRWQRTIQCVASEHAATVVCHWTRRAILQTIVAAKSVEDNGALVLLHQRPQRLHLEAMRVATEHAATIASQILFVVKMKVS